MAQGHEKDVCCMRMSSLLISLMFRPSPFAVSARSLREHFTDAPVPHDPAELSRPKSAGQAHSRTRTSSLATWPRPVLLTGYEPKEFDKITSVDVDTPSINDPDHNISDFSKTTSENTGHSVLNPLFCTFLIGDFALQRESKESMPRENRCKAEKERKEKVL